MANEAMFQEAQNALAAGQRERAKDLLTRLLRNDQNNAEYWLWMSAAVETPGEQIFCLEKALKIDPNNTAVRRGLILLGALPPNEALQPVAPARRRRVGEIAAEQRMSIKVSVGKPGSLAGGGWEQMWEQPAIRYTLIGVGGLVALALIVGIILGLSRNARPVARLTITPNPTPTGASPTPTMLPTPSPVVKSPTPTFIGPTPLWMFLEATYTATPRYIATQHAILESYRAGLRAYDRGDYASMAQHLQQASRDDPGAADILYYLGEAYRLLGKYSDALDTFNQAIKVNPGFAPPYLGRARARLALDPKADVSKDLDQAIAIDPNLREAYLERAAFQISKNDPQAALEDLSIAEALPLPVDPMLYVWRAHANLLAGENAAALADARRAHELDFTLLPAYLAMGQAYLANGDLAQAEENTEIYLRYVTTDPQAYLLMGQIYEQKQDYQAALEAFDTVLRLNENLMEGYWRRGRIYIALGEGNKAVNDLVKAQRQNNQSFDINLDLGRAFMVAERLNDAYRQLTLAEKLAASDSQRAAVYFWRAQVLELAANKRAAEADWRALLALPAEAVPPEWLTFANEHLLILVSPTPSATNQPSATFTPEPTASPSPSATASPSSTPTATRSPSPLAPSRTPTQ